MNDKTSNLENQLLHKPKLSFKNLIRLWKFVFSSTKTISTIYLSLFILLSVMRVVLAYIWKEYISYAESKSVANILIMFLLLILYWAIYHISSFIDSFMSVNGDGDMEQLDAVQGNRQQEKMHSKIFEKIHNLSPECFEISNINDKIKYVFDFAGNPRTGINRTIMLKGYIIIAKAISIISITYSLYLFHPILCVLVLFAPLPLLWSSFVNQKINFNFKYDNTQNLRKIEYYQNLMLSPNSNKEIRTMGLFDFFYDKWKKEADEYTINEWQMIRKRTIINSINSFVVSAINISGIIITLFLMLLDKISISSTSAVISLFSTLLNDTASFLTSIIDFLSKKREASVFFELIDLPEERKKGTSIGDFEILVTKNLKYRYPLTDKYVLDNINLTVYKGEKIAFVGENGSGKTTLIKLILGIINPSDGELTVNGIPMEERNHIDLYKNQSTVVQNPVHYTTFTIRDNIEFGNIEKKSSEDMILESMKFAGIDYLNDSTLLGKDVGGADISGGEWQRLTIARTHYKNSSFLILDEPTSNLDPVTESDIFNKYLKLANNKTVIYVTHRISLAALADRIIVLKDGKIVQSGKHKELIADNGEYKRLYEEQAKWYN